MQVFEQKKYSTYCCTFQTWSDVLKTLSADDKVSVLDIRTLNELGKDELSDMPSGWTYRRYPITGSTVSEQDVDVFRREQRRFGKLVVVSSNETRASLLVLTDLARINRTLLPEAEVTKLEDLKQEQAMHDWLNQYLERHQTTDVVGEY